MRTIVVAGLLALAGCAGTPNANAARQICIENGHATGTEGFHRCFETTYAAIMGDRRRAVRAPVTCRPLGNTMVCD
jgi:hypothetical protein